MPTEVDVQSLFDEAVPLQNALLPNHCKLIPGVLTTVTQLRYVITNILTKYFH